MARQGFRNVSSTTWVSNLHKFISFLKTGRNVRGVLVDYYPKKLSPINLRPPIVKTPKASSKKTCTRSGAKRPFRRSKKKFQSPFFESRVRHSCEKLCWSSTCFRILKFLKFLQPLRSGSFHYSTGSDHFWISTTQAKKFSVRRQLKVQKVIECSARAHLFDFFLRL